MDEKLRQEIIDVLETCETVGKEDDCWCPMCESDQFYASNEPVHSPNCRLKALLDKLKGVSNA